VPQKIAQLQGLFDLFEKHLNVPAPAVEVAHRARAPAQIVGDKNHQAFFSAYFDQRLHASQQHAFVLGVLEDDELVFENAFDAFGEGLFYLVGHVLFGAAHPPDLALIQISEVLEIDVGLVEDDDFTWGNTRTDLACPLVVVMGSGVDNGKGRKKAVKVEPQVHFGSGLASTVFGPTNAVGDQFHDSGVDGVNLDLETAQEALAFFARGKARMDVLKMFEYRPEKRFDEVGRTHLVCVGKSVAGGRYDLETAQSRCFEPKPVANVVETDGMRKLGKEHGSQVAQNAKGASLCVHPCFTGCLIEEASRYGVEKLLENDNVGAGWFLVHNPTEW